MNPNRRARIGNDLCGPGQPLLVIAGPCVIEDQETCLEIGRHLAAIGRELPIRIVFKASFDKANRTAAGSFRGPGLDGGLSVLERVRMATGLPVTTDVHLPEQAARSAGSATCCRFPRSSAGRPTCCWPPPKPARRSMSKRASSWLPAT